MDTRKPYPTDVSDEEWAFVAPYLTLMSPDAPQRTYDLREVFNALRWIVRAGAPWRLLPNDFPRWEAVYQQTQRWLAAGSCEAIVHDLRALLRVAAGREAQPSAVIFDGCTLQSTPESGPRGLRRAPAQARLQSPHGGGHAGPPPRPAGDPRQRAGARPGGRVGAAGPGGDRGARRAGLCGSRLHRRGRGGRRAAARYPPGGGQAARGQTRLCPLAPPLGG